MSKINITIDDKVCVAESAQTILQVATQNNISIPTLCYHPDVKVQGSCRLCLVEIKDRKGMFTACNTLVAPNMVVVTQSAAIKKAHAINLELIFTEHCEECIDCIWQKNCAIKSLAAKHNIKIDRYPDRKVNHPVHNFSQAMILDSKKCVDCGLCVDMCREHIVDFLEINKRGDFFEVMPSADKKKDCIYCGQCLVHCPVGAFEGVGEYEDIAKPMQEKNKIVVFQFAPSIRSVIGEEFGLPYGTVVTNQLAAAIRRLGVKYVFDTSVGADMTTIEEAKEIIERLRKNKNLPMFTSCCPAWVKYIEFYRPDLIPNLTTVRSPQTVTGGLIKTYWAERNHINPKDILVVSIMPCIAKKYEVDRPELRINGLRPVDYVLTTRELAKLLKSKKIDLASMPDNEPPDEALGEHTGAAVIYGASGGVMESAIRSTYYKITGKKLQPINYLPVRGAQGLKKAVLKIDGMTIKVAVANRIANAKLILEELAKDPHAYDYVEVMACPGGCIGGGGQSVPVNDDIRAQRAAGLYAIDKNKKRRLADDSPVMKKIYDFFAHRHQLLHRVAHTTYHQKNKEVYPIWQKEKSKK